MQIVHLADTHLGARPYHYQELEEDVLRAFEEAIDYVVETRPDALLVAGDFFDKPRMSHEVIIYTLNQLRRVTSKGTPVILAHGEHDTPGRRDRTLLELLAEAEEKVYAPRPAGSSVEEIVSKSIIRLDKGTVAVYRFNKAPIEAQRRYNQRILPAYEAALRAVEKPRVFLAHIGVEGPLPPDASNANVSDLPSVEYAALGHHHGRWIHRGENQGPRLAVYTGSLYPLNIREARSQHTRGPILVDLSGDEPVIQEEYKVEVAKHIVLREVEVPDSTSVRKRLEPIVSKAVNREGRIVVHLPLAVYPAVPRARVENAVADLAKRHGVIIVPHIRRVQAGGPSGGAREGERGEPVLDPVQIIVSAYGVSKATAELILELKNALVEGNQERAGEIIEELASRGELVEVARKKRWLR